MSKISKHAKEIKDKTNNNNVSMGTQKHINAYFDIVVF